MTKRLSDKELQKTIDVIESSYTPPEAAVKLGITTANLYKRLRTNGLVIKRSPNKLEVVKNETI